MFPHMSILNCFQSQNNNRKLYFVQYFDSFFLIQLVIRNLLTKYSQLARTQRVNLCADRKQRRITQREGQKTNVIYYRINPLYHNR